VLLRVANLPGERQELEDDSTAGAHAFEEDNRSMLDVHHR
jgi:hypothetical protein